jgi:hypothetical protein
VAESHACAVYNILGIPQGNFATLDSRKGEVGFISMDGVSGLEEGAPYSQFVKIRADA